MGVIGLVGGSAVDDTGGGAAGDTDGVRFGGVGSLALLIVLATELVVELSKRWRLDSGTGVGIVPVSFSMGL
jgi:hypothetical protein